MHLYKHRNLLLDVADIQTTRRYFENKRDKENANRLSEFKWRFNTFCCCASVFYIACPYNTFSISDNVFLYWFVLFFVIGSICIVCSYNPKGEPGYVPKFLYVKGDGKIKSTDRQVIQMVKKILGYPLSPEGQKKITLGCKAMEWNAEQLDKTSVPLCFLGYQWFHNLSKYNQDELYNMLEIISKDFADKEGLEIVKKKVKTERFLNRHVPEKLQKYV